MSVVSELGYWIVAGIVLMLGMYFVWELGKKIKEQVKGKNKGGEQF